MFLVRKSVLFSLTILPFEILKQNVLMFVPCSSFSVYCPNPGHIKNGKSYKKGTRGSFIFHPYITSIRHGDRVEYKCDAGYKLEGPNGAMCINGHWYPDIKKGLSKCVHAMHPVFTKLWKPLQESAADKR